MDHVIEQILHLEEVEQAIASRWGEDHERERALYGELHRSDGHEKEDTLSYFSSSPERDERSPERGTKHWMDWIEALEDIE